MIYFNSEKKSPLLAFIKSEPIFLTGSLVVCLSAPVQGEAGGRGGGGGVRPRGPPPFRRDFFKIAPAGKKRSSCPPPRRGLASRFSGKFQAVLNSVRPKAGFSKSYEIFYLHKEIYGECRTTSDVS